MEAYRDFAEVYDELMDDVPYDRWTEEVVALLGEYGINDGLVCELGCGTGNITRRMADAGYDMIGIDSSSEMLSIARDKEKGNGGTDILYLCQDMRSFELYGTVRSVICLCDSINYILTDEDMDRTFKLVNNYLDPKGLFIFDFNTIYKYKSIGDSVIAENREDCSFIWENSYDEATHLNEYELTLFTAEGTAIAADSGIYRKSVEEHIQRGFDVMEMKKLIEASGLKLIRMLDCDTLKEPGDKSERILAVAMENGKNE